MEPYSRLAHPYDRRRKRSRLRRIRRTLEWLLPLLLILLAALLSAGVVRVMEVGAARTALQRTSPRTEARAAEAATASPGAGVSPYVAPHIEDPTPLELQEDPLEGIFRSSVLDSQAKEPEEAGTGALPDVSAPGDLDTPVEPSEGAPDAAAASTVDAAAVPEPRTLLLVATGLVVAAARARPTVPRGSPAARCRR